MTSQWDTGHHSNTCEDGPPLLSTEKEVVAWGLNTGESARPQQGWRPGLVHLGLMHSNCGSVARYNPFRLIGYNGKESPIVCPTSAHNCAAAGRAQLTYLPSILGTEL